MVRWLLIRLDNHVVFNKKYPAVVIPVVMQVNRIIFVKRFKMRFCDEIDAEKKVKSVLIC